MAVKIGFVDGLSVLHIMIGIDIEAAFLYRGEDQIEPGICIRSPVLVEISVGKSQEDKNDESIFFIFADHGFSHPVSPRPDHLWIPNIHLRTALQPSGRPRKTGFGMQEGFQRVYQGRTPLQAEVRAGRTRGLGLKPIEGDPHLSQAHRNYFFLVKPFTEP
jgi:hypothetical protein